MRIRHEARGTRHESRRSVIASGQNRVVPSLRGALATKQPHVIVILLLLFVLIAGCSSSAAKTTETKPGTVSISAAKTTARPAIDGKINDNAWNQATAVEVPLTPETGVEASSIELRALSDGDNIYLAANYKDATPRKMNLAWEYDGTKWARGSYDDSLSFVWDIDGSIPGFAENGLGVMSSGLKKGADIFDFTLQPKDDKTAAGHADYWGW